MDPPHQFVRPIWDDGPYNSTKKLFFTAEAADNFQESENGHGVTFQLAGRHLTPSYRVDFANRFTVFTDPKPDEKPELEGKVEFVASDKVRIQIATN